MDFKKITSSDEMWNKVSDHENIYEKYGFEIIDHKTAPWG